MKQHIIEGPKRRIEGSIKVPGDKSISHRALLVGAMGDGTMAVINASTAEDVRSSLAAIAQLGVRTSPTTLEHHVRVEGYQSSAKALDSQILVYGRGTDALANPDRPIDVGNSGTTIRILAGLLAGTSVSAVLTGDQSIRRRPMDRVVDPLSRMGARITATVEGRYAPLKIVGAQLVGTHHRLSVPSAQVKSALLLAGLNASGTTTVLEPSRSRDHTERLLRHLGVPITESIDGLSVKSTKLQNDEVTVPGDLSSAAFVLVAAAILPGSRVSVEDVGVNPTRTGLLSILERYGAAVSTEGVRTRSGEPAATVTVAAGDRRAVTVEAPETVAAIDELPLVAVLGTAAEGETLVRDAGELRVKESDRIAVMCRALSAMGARIEPRPDGFSVWGPTRLHGATVSSAGDHRIAMALAVAALTATGTTVIEGWEAVDVSYPGFEHDLASVVVP